MIRSSIFAGMRRCYRRKNRLLWSGSCTDHRIGRSKRLRYRWWRGRKWREKTWKWRCKRWRNGRRGTLSIGWCRNGDGWNGGRGSGRVEEKRCSILDFVFYSSAFVTWTFIFMDSTVSFSKRHTSKLTEALVLFDLLFKVPRSKLSPINFFPTVFFLRTDVNHSTRREPTTGDNLTLFPLAVLISLNYLVHCRP